MSTARKSIIDKIESGEIACDYFAYDDEEIYYLWKNLKVKEQNAEVMIDDYLTWMEKELEKAKNS